MATSLLMIPTLNEEQAISALLDEAIPYFSRTIIVDGGSTDRTRKIAFSRNIMVVDQKFGPGKGCGVRTGFEYFLQSGEDFLCIMDGDQTNIPKDLASLLGHADEADIILGSRIRGNRDKGAMNVTTFASNLTVSLLLGLKFLRIFTDVQTGYWVFNRRAVEKLQFQLASAKFEIELEMFTKALRSGLRLKEYPVGFRKRAGKTKFSFGLRMRSLYFAFKYLLLG